MIDYKLRAAKLESMIRDWIRDLKNPGKKTSDEMTRDIMEAIILEKVLEIVLEDTNGDA